MGFVNQRIIDGDNEEFNEWLQPLLHKVELLSVQYGVTLQDAKTITETVFRDLYLKRNLLTNEQFCDDDVIRIALTTMASFELKPPADRLFTFVEDDNLHNRITALREELRIAFILLQFHAKSHLAIAGILELPEQQVTDAIAEAIRELDEPNFEKRLELLHRSYNRLPSLSEQTNIFISESVVQAAVEGKNVKKLKKKTLLLFGGGALVLLLFLFATVINSKSYQQALVEKFIESAEKEFKEKLDRWHQLSGISSDIDIQRFNSINGSRKYDMRIKHELFINDLKKQLRKTGNFDRKKARSQQNNLIQRVSLPIELIDQLEKKPLVNDKEESLKFLGGLAESEKMLHFFYEFVLRENRNKVIGESYDILGTDYLEKLQDKEEILPTRLQEAIDGMQTQGFSLISITSDYVYPIFGNEEIRTALKENLHPDTQFYVSYVTDEKLEIKKWSLDEQVENLLVIEQDLLSADGKNFDQMVSDSYTTLLYLVIGFNDIDKIYTPFGIVNDEYRDAWLKIASHRDNSVSAQLMQDVVQEMRASGWTYSAKREELINLIENGNFKQKLLKMKQENM